MTEALSRNAGTNTFTLLPGGHWPLAMHAEFVVIAAASGAFDMRVDEGGVLENLSAGWTYRAPGVDGFRKVDFFNRGASPVTLTIQYGWGELRDSRLSVSGVVDTREVFPPIFSSAAPVSIGAASGAVVLAANAGRVKGWVSNVGAETVWLNGAGTAAEGLPLAPGETREIETLATVYAFNPSAAAVNIARAWTERA